MAHWKVKSESDSEKVYAHVSRGEETGRYRYAFEDGHTVEVGPEGLHAESPDARHPVKVRVATAVVAASAAGMAVLADVVWHLAR